MHAEVIGSVERLEELLPSWERLWLADPRATPFQSPWWVLESWRAFPLGELFAVAVEERGELLAFAPFFILRDEDSGESLGMLVGTGVSDYLDILAIRPGATDLVIEAMSRAGCAMWDLQELRPDSPLLHATSSAFGSSSEEQDRCPVLDLTPSRGIESIVSPRFAKNLRYCRRIAERAGAFRIERAADVGIDDALSELFRLHELRWKQRGLPGVLADETVQQFHRRVARDLASHGALRMYVAHLDSACVGVFYGFAHNGVCYYYLSGYDPALEKFSIGTQLVAHAITSAIGEGAAAFDFMRGAEEYKYAWGAVDRVNSRRQLVRMEARKDEDERGAAAGLAVDPV